MQIVNLNYSYRKDCCTIQEQLTIFDTVTTENDVKPSPTAQNKNTTLNSLPQTEEVAEQVYIGQKVKLKLPKDTESEEYYYIRYYCEHLLKITGEIESFSTTAAGKVVCVINFRGDIYTFYDSELTLL